MPTRAGHAAPARSWCSPRIRHASLGALPLWHLELLLEVWADRYRELGARATSQYVFPFENRGVEVGVTLHHPHGQIYAYPFVPPVPARELAQQRAYFDEHGSGLLEDLIARRSGGRPRGCSTTGARAVAFMPVCRALSVRGLDRAARDPLRSVADLDAAERADFARALKTVLLKYDRLWGRPFPYIMVVHQAPTDGQPHPEAHLHIEFYPAYRMPRPAEVSGRQRDRRRRVHRRHAARGEGRGAARGRGVD